LTLVLLGQVLFELYQLYKGPGLDRPGKLQSTFLAASCTFLLALSFGSPSLQRLTLWPTLVVSIGRAESLRQKKTALALLLFGVALLADRFLRLS
jgi:hypothetical protein